MANKSVNVFLNAYDNTSSATQSASDNIAGYADSIVASNAAAAASFDMIGSAAESSLLASLAAFASAAAPVIVAAGAIAVAGYLIYRNWESIAPVVESAASAIAGSLGGLANYVTGALESMIGGTLTWSNAMKFLQDAGFASLAVLEYAWKNIGDVGSLALTTLELGVVQYANRLAYTFTEVVPSLLIWFVENWRELFTDIYNFTGTVISNMHENLVRFFTAIFEYLQGNGFSFEWKGLTDGFEATLSKLPEIAERRIGPLEAELQKKFDDLGDKVSKGMFESVVRRLTDIPGFKKDIGEFASSIPKQLAGFAGQFGDMLGFGGRGAGRGSQNAGLPEGDSSRFLTGSAAAGQEQLAREQLEIQRRMEEQQKQQSAIISAIRASLGPDVAGLLQTGRQVSSIVLGD